MLALSGPSSPKKSKDTPLTLLGALAVCFTRADLPTPPAKDIRSSPPPGKPPWLRDGEFFPLSMAAFFAFSMGFLSDFFETLGVAFCLGFRHGLGLQTGCVRGGGLYHPIKLLSNQRTSPGISQRQIIEIPEWRCFIMDAFSPHFLKRNFIFRKRILNPKSLSWKLDLHFGYFCEVHFVCERDLPRKRNKITRPFPSGTDPSPPPSQPSASRPKRYAHDDADDAEGSSGEGDTGRTIAEWLLCVWSHQNKINRELRA